MGEKLLEKTPAWQKRWETLQAIVAPIVRNVATPKRSYIRMENTGNTHQEPLPAFSLFFLVLLKQALLYYIIWFSKFSGSLVFFVILCRTREKGSA